MYIDLDSLNSYSHVARNQARELVKKGGSEGYLSILHAVPIHSRTKVQKSATTRVAANKPKQPFKPTRESPPGSTIGPGHPNATSNLSGSPRVAPKPSGIEAVLASVMETLADALKIASPIPRDTTTQALASTIAEDRRRAEADEWNSRRSAAQRASFTFHASKAESQAVKLPVSAHAVRMSGSLFAAAPTSVQKSEVQPRFDDTYMQRRT